MSFNVENAQKHIENNKNEYVSKLVGGAETASLLISTGNVQTGVDTESPILKLDVDVTFQSGASCSRTPLGTTTLSDAILKVAKIKINENYCFADLDNLFHTSRIFKGGSDPELNVDAAFTQRMIDQKILKVSCNNEVALWNGDVTSTNLNLKHYDGILKQANAAVASTGADIVEKIQNICLEIDPKILAQDDFRLFMDHATYNQYLVALSRKNYYHPENAMTVHGLGTKIQLTTGLAGSDTIVATRLSNLRLGLDLVSDFENVKFMYSIETENYYLDIYFKIGIAIVEKSELKAFTV